MHHGISWVLLVTDKYQESLVFYRDVLGFQIEREVAGEMFCQFSLGNCYLAIYGREELEKLLDKKYLGKAGGAIYSFPESDNIDEDVELLKSKGVRFIKEPATQPWGQRTAYFTDPDGHIWELQQWLKKP
jgi:lactoylglutathione lyase